MDDIISKINPFHGIPKYHIAQQIINFGLIVSTALMIWKFLIIVSGCESPIVVVLTGSMEPGFQRGDLLYLHYDETKPIRSGEVVVFQLKNKEIPIVHRVLNVHENESQEYLILTKGDANPVDDRSLYNPGQRWLNREHIMGKVGGYLPYVGMVTIIMHDYPQVKILLIVVLAIFVLSTRE